MNALRYLLAAICLASVTGHATPPPIIVPSDIAVTLTATPTVNLVPGQRIYFTLTVTNLGPATVNDLIVKSSPIYGEFDLSTGTVDCQYMALQVVDGTTDFYYLYDWSLAGSPLGQPDFAVGETLTCHISFLITAQAPAVTPFTFGLPSSYVDINPSNDSATVFLHRAIEPIPTLSPATLLLLAGLLAMAAGVVLGYRQSSP